MNLSTMSNEEVFALRNAVIAEASKRSAVVEIQERLAAVLSNAGVSEIEADSAFENAKASVFTEESA